MRFITCRLPDGVEDPAILSADGRQVWPLSWLGLLMRYCPTPSVPDPAGAGRLSLAIAGIPALPIEASHQSPSVSRRMSSVWASTSMASDEAEKYSADAFATKHQDAIYFSSGSRAVPDLWLHRGPYRPREKLDYGELAVVLGRTRGRSRRADEDFVFGTLS